MKKNEEIVSRLNSLPSELLVRIVPSGVFVVDNDRRIILWNDRAEKITGYKREEVIGRECLLFADEPCKDSCGLFNNDEVKPLLNRECSIKTKSGDIKIISKNADLLYNEAGEKIGGIESFEDITASKKIEEELRKSESKFRDIWENSVDGLRITDNEGVIRDVNDSFCRIMKKEKPDLIGKKLDSVYSPNSGINYLDIYLERARKNNFSPREELNVRLWDESKMWLSITTFSIKEEKENLWISLFRNISDAKKSELIHKVIYEISTAVFQLNDLPELLSQIRDILSQIVNTKNFVFALLNEETGMLSIPFQSSEIEQFVETPMKDTFSGYVILTNESLLMNKEESYKMVAEGKAKMVGVPAEIWMGVPIRAEGKVFGVMVIQDYEDKHAFGLEELNLLEFVSDQIGAAVERIRSREALENSERALRTANSTKDRFFSIIAHDLKNPFLTLKGYLEIINEDFDCLSEEEIKNYISTLMNVSNKTFDLLEDLLLWSRAQQNMIEIEPVTVELKSLVESGVEPLLETAGKKNIKLIVDIDPKVLVFCDKFTSRTVIRNLVSNSIKFSNSGDKITITVEPNKDHIKVKVADTGIGMKDDVSKNLFRLDKTVTQKGTSDEEGTGLGLMLCKDFVEKNGGRIYVKSEYGSGTTVSFTIPK